jgi:WD40 repeat protein
MREHTLDRSEHVINAVDFSPDGEFIAGASKDGNIVLWDAETKSMTYVPGTNTYSLLCVAFSPDGTRVAAAGTSHNIEVWNISDDLINRVPPSVLRGHKGTVFSVRFSPNGRHIASASYDGSVKIWDAMWHQNFAFAFWEHCAAEMTVQTDTNLFCVAWSDDSRRLASAGTDTQIRLWAFDPHVPQLQSFQGTEPNRIPGGVSHPRRPGGATGSSRLAAMSCGWCKLRHSCLLDCSKPLKLFGHRHWVTSVAFNRAGSMLASGSRDMTARIWNVDTCYCVKKIMFGHKGPVSTVAWSPDDKFLLTACDDWIIRLWSGTNGAHVKDIAGHGNTVQGVAWPNDNCSFVSASTDSSVRLWDMTDEVCAP